MGARSLIRRLLPAWPVPPRLRPEQPPIERASATDRAFMAMDAGDVPEQFGVVLELDGGADLLLRQVQDLVADRIQAVPRLRQRLVGVPFGCGGPIWVDDAGFDIGDHVRELECAAPGDETALLDTALAVVTAPLSWNAPLWSAVLVTGLQSGRAALVVVLHHALADGIGGLAVLAHLVDPGSGSGSSPGSSPESGPGEGAGSGPRNGSGNGSGAWAFPRPRPTTASLARDAWATKLQAARDVRRSWRLLRTSTGAGGGLRPPRIAACSLNQQTGPQRRVAVVRAELAGLRAGAHRRGATTNDAVLVAVAGALREVLARRGEVVDPVAITVPVSGRRTADGPELGNLVSPLLVAVPTTGEVGRRLAAVAQAVRAGKADATGPPPIALLGWLFRPLAALGGYRWYMNHQRRFHTLVSHLRGPAEPFTFAGLTIDSAVPMGVAEGGNATVYFQVLSYGGTITVSAIVDPDHFPDLEVLVEALRAELALIAGEVQVSIPEQRQSAPALDSRPTP